MTRLTRFVSSLILYSAAASAIQGWPAPSQRNSSQIDSAVTPSAFTLPAGTKVDLALIVPVWARKVRLGDPLYAQTNFPVVTGNRVAIPAGTWVQGRIEGTTLPTRRQNRAELQVLFTRIVFANGYTIALPDLPGESASTLGVNSPPSTSIATAASITIEASTSNDLLLDNGAQIEMTLAAPLALDSGQIANAIPLTRPPEPGKFKSATLCRSTPGSPGTPGSPDTVIPGSPGTPSITIPGGPGMPDTTIPGTPATPDTVIPGSPGTPGTPGSACPAAPIVLSSVPVILGPSHNKSSTSPSAP